MRTELDLKGKCKYSMGFSITFCQVGTYYLLLIQQIYLYLRIFENEIDKLDRIKENLILSHRDKILYNLNLRQYLVFIQCLQMFLKFEKSPNLPVLKKSQNL